MGTLFEQKPRDSVAIYLDEFLSISVQLAKKHKVPVADVIAAKHALELQRKNDLAVRDGDAHDEQVAGFGDLFIELNSRISELSEAVEKLHPEQE